MKNLLIFAVLTITLSLSVFAQQKLSEPKKGSAERTSLMDAIRDYDIQHDAKLIEEKFIVLALRTQGNWAFAHVQQQEQNGMESYGVAQVFLQKIGKKWKVGFSTYNDHDELGVDGLAKLKKKHKDFPKQLAEYAMGFLAG
jgi:hypothetical protein